MNITKKNNIIEIICFLIFCIITIFVSFFHEPWFDEMQAWGISCDSLYNILFVIPHLEGHPPLWHLILKCFSVFGINPEIGLKISNLSFMILSIWLLIFKSPFPKYVKLLLPFTYFLFYQYSIVNRPYSILCFFLFLSAYLYPTRNIHPYKFIFSLMGLSLSSVYGMVFAVGITIYWLIEIIKEQKKIEFYQLFY